MEIVRVYCFNFSTVNHFVHNKITYWTFVSTVKQVAILVVSAVVMLTSQLVLILLAQLVMFVYTDKPYKQRVKSYTF